MIWEFLPGMELSAFEAEAYPVYEDLISKHNFDGMVTDVQLEDPFTPEAFEVWEKSAQRADQAGLNDGQSSPTASKRSRWVAKSIPATLTL